MKNRKIALLVFPGALFCCAQPVGAQLRTATFSNPAGVPISHLPDVDGRLVSTSQNFVEDGVHVESLWIGNDETEFMQGHFHHLENGFETMHGFETTTGFGPDVQGIYVELAEGGTFDLLSFDARRQATIPVGIKVATALDPANPVFIATYPVAGTAWQTIGVAGVWDATQLFLAGDLGTSPLQRIQFDNLRLGIAEDAARDDFDTGSLIQGSGAWVGPWTYQGAVGIGSIAGHPRAVRMKSTGSLRRTVDLRGVLNARLLLSVNVLSFEAFDSARVEVVIDNGPPTLLRTFTAADSDGLFHDFALGLPGIPATANVEIAFVTSTQGDASDYFFVDDVRVRGVVTAGTPPVAVAGPDQRVEVESSHATVTLDGSASNDPDGTIVSYSWTEGGVELGNTAMLETSLPLGPHTLVLTLVDSAGLVGSDDVLVVVNPPTRAHDGFESSAFLTGGIGSWTGPWLAEGDIGVGSPSSEGTRAIRIKNTGSLTRTAIVPSPSNVRVMFDARVLSYEAGDVARLAYSTDGFTFTTLREFSVADSDGLFHYYDYALDLSTLAPSGEVTFSFSADTTSVGTNNDHFLIDALRIVGQ